MVHSDVDGVFDAGRNQLLKVLLDDRRDDFHPQYMCTGCFMIRAIYDQMTEPWKLNQSSDSSRVCQLGSHGDG